MVLKSIGDHADMRARVDLKAVCDSEDGVKFHGIESQSDLIADIHRDGAILLEIADVLIDQCER